MKYCINDASQFHFRWLCVILDFSWKTRCFSNLTWNIHMLTWDALMLKFIRYRELWWPQSWPPLNTIVSLKMTNVNTKYGSIHCTHLTIPCLQGFHFLNSFQFKWPLTSTTINSHLSLNITNLNTKNKSYSFFIHFCYFETPCLRAIYKVYAESYLVISSEL